MAARPFVCRRLQNWPFETALCTNEVICSSVGARQGESRRGL